MAEEAWARPEDKGRVLVVDDIDANRELLSNLLVSAGFEVEEAKDGLVALEAVATHPPDVVLMDIQMPRMDGLEACRRLKESPSTASIPVLMVTALTQRTERLEGIRAGANDLVTKPVDGTDLLLRVRNSLRMSRLYRQLEEQYRELKELEGLRDNLVHMLVHDLRSPLAALSGNLQLAAQDVEGPDAVREDLLHATQSVGRLADMIGDILDVSRLEAHELPLSRETVDLRTVFDRAIDVTLQAGRARVEREWPSEVVEASVDPGVLARILANLVDNALKFSPADQVVRVSMEKFESGIRLSVTDHGPGVPIEARAGIFDKFRQARQAPGSRRSSGLGLAFCRLAAEAHGGTIGVDEAPEEGTIFWFEIPTGSPVT